MAATTSTIVLCSGGLASAVLAAMLRKDGPITPLFVASGHPSDNQQEAAVTALLAGWGIASHSRLTLPGGPAERTLVAAAGAEAPPQPSLAQLVAATRQWAVDNPAQAIYVGLCGWQSDPGLTVESFDSILWQYGEPPDVPVEAPFLDLTRADVVRIGQKLRVPFERTRSCLAAATAPCGSCAGCVRRAAAFREALVADSLFHEAASLMT